MNPLDVESAALRLLRDTHRLVVVPVPSGGLLRWAEETRVMRPVAYAFMVPFVAVLAVVCMVLGRLLAWLGRGGERLCGWVGWDVWGDTEATDAS